MSELSQYLRAGYANPLNIPTAGMDQGIPFLLAKNLAEGTSSLEYLLKQKEHQDRELEAMSAMLHEKTSGLGTSSLSHWYNMKKLAEEPLAAPTAPAAPAAPAAPTAPASESGVPEEPSFIERATAMAQAVPGQVAEGLDRLGDVTQRYVAPFIAKPVEKVLSGYDSIMPGISDQEYSGLAEPTAYQRARHYLQLPTFARRYMDNLKSDLDYSILGSEHTQESREDYARRQAAALAENRSDVPLEQRGLTEKFLRHARAAYGSDATGPYYKPVATTPAPVTPVVAEPPVATAPVVQAPSPQATSEDSPEGGWNNSQEWDGGFSAEPQYLQSIAPTPQYTPEEMQAARDTLWWTELRNAGVFNSDEDILRQISNGDIRFFNNPVTFLGGGNRGALQQAAIEELYKRDQMALEKRLDKGRRRLAAQAADEEFAKQFSSLRDTTNTVLSENTQAPLAPPAPLAPLAPSAPSTSAPPPPTHQLSPLAPPVGTSTAQEANVEESSSVPPQAPSVAPQASDTPRLSQSTPDQRRWQWARFLNPGHEAYVKGGLPGIGGVRRKSNPNSLISAREARNLMSRYLFTGEDPDILGVE